MSEEKKSITEITVIILAIGALLMVLVALLLYQTVLSESDSGGAESSAPLEMQGSYRNMQQAMAKCEQHVRLKSMEYGEQIYNIRLDRNSSQYMANQDKFDIFFNLILDTPYGRKDSWASCRMNAVDYRILEFKTPKR